MKLCYKLKMHRGIDGMFALSSGLCSWINEIKFFVPYINLKTNTMNDKSANFPSIYYVLSETYPLPDFFELASYCICGFVDSHHASLSH